MKTKHLWLTPGDPDGIGYECLFQSLTRPRLKPKFSKDLELHICGAEKGFLKKEVKALAKIKNLHFHFSPKSMTHPGAISGWAIEESVKHHPDALVTGPISKERLQAGGYPFHGHTDFLKSLTKSTHVTMVLENKTFTIALLTDHVPLSQVANTLSYSAFRWTALQVSNYLKVDRKLRDPKIQVLGLNPHAGEEGVLGHEETLWLNPWVKMVQAEGLKGLKPCVSADSYFAQQLKLSKTKRNDATIAVYHDQGLIPLKLMGMGESVNLTLGLPFVRTSVDHGTAFSIARKGQADPKSFAFAINKALHLLSKDYGHYNSSVDFS